MVIFTLHSVLIQHKNLISINNQIDHLKRKTNSITYEITEKGRSHVDTWIKDGIPFESTKI